MLWSCRIAKFVLFFVQIVLDVDDRGEGLGRLSIGVSSALPCCWRKSSWDAVDGGVDIVVEVCLGGRRVASKGGGEDGGEC